MEDIKRFEKGIALLKAEKFKEALVVFNDLIEDFPNSADCWSERGVVHFHLNNRKEALADMDKAVNIEPLKSYRYSSRAYIRGHYGMASEAIEDYKKAIELDPEDAIAYNNLGLLEERLGYKEIAKQRFEIADHLQDGTLMGSQKQDKVQGTPIDSRNIQKEIDEKRENRSVWSVLKTLSTKEGRASFKRFLKSGFKEH